MKRIVIILIGTLSLGLGVLGIFLPVLPTTPFLIVALACYLRSSPKLYHFILHHKYLGPYVKDYVLGKGIPIKAKKKAIFMIWLTISFSVIFILDQLILRALLLVIASCVSVYIWTRKSLKEPIKKNK